jgi:methylenetetrahydrofolate reductase (NADPH)
MAGGCRTTECLRGPWKAEESTWRVDTGGGSQQSTTYLMKIAELFNQSRLVLSFEVFPPKPEIPLTAVFNAIQELKSLNPAFISVTYGAGGSQKGRTVEIASRIKNEIHLEAVAHLTCVGHTRHDIDEILTQLKAAHIENILALRGDPPLGQPDFDFSKGEFKYASELIEYVRQRYDFCVIAAAYPEGHRSSPRISGDWQNLKRKVETGVDVLITQLFFDNRIFYHFLETVRAMGISCPIIPGIMPIFNAKQIKRILSLCGASMPADLLTLVDKYENSPEDMKKAGLDFAVRQIQDLLANDVDGIHLEPMNKPELAREILSGIGYIAPGHQDFSSPSSTFQ